MVKFILLLFRPFRKIMEWAGVNYQQFEVILQAKLTMDNRKVVGNNTQNKSMKNSILLQIFFYGVIGGTMSLTLIRSNSLFLFSTIFFSFVMIMVIMGLISEFSTILFDTRDNSILLPLPITPRTMLFARIIHIMVYLMSISLSLSIIPLIVFVFKFGVPAMFLLLADVILITLFAVFLTNIIYLLLMKFTTGERLKDIIVYSQILMTIVFMGAYQIMPRLAQNESFITSLTAVHWWMFLVPPFWMSASITPILNGGFNIQSAGFLFLSVSMPVLGLWLVTSVLAKNFSQSLSTLDQGDTKSEKKKRKAETSSYVDFLSRIFSYSTQEGISFSTIWHIASRDRKFKQTVYPSFGLVFIFIIMFFVNGNTHFSELGLSKEYLFLIYAPSLVLINLVSAIQFSDNFKASWIYQTIPVQLPGQIMSGAYKAILVKLFLPIFIVLNIVTLYIWGISVLSDVVFGLFVTLMTSYVMLLINSPVFPFSGDILTAQSGKKVMRNFLSIFFLGVLIGIHYWLITQKINVLYISPVILGILFFLSRQYRLTPWHKMSKMN